jgi:DNA-binding GntR family transcriptional regulator
MQNQPMSDHVDSVSSGDPTTKKRGSATRASQIGNRIKADIQRGVLRPGAWLRLEDLREEFGVSWSPIRESMSALVAAGLVVSDGGRAYHVAPISKGELVEVLEMRLILEAKALRKSIEHGDDVWERELVATHHQLRKLEQQRWQTEQLEEWERWHRGFHSALIRACGSPLLMQYCLNLYDISDRYRRLFLSVHPRDRDISGEHEAILKATLARDAGEASRLMQVHVRRTLETILNAMPD